MLKIFFLLLLSFNAMAQMNFCTKDLESYPTQAGGREKPLYVLASETVRFMTGESKIGEFSATEAFCKLSLKAFGMPLDLPVNIKVDHVEVKKLLAMDDKATSIPVERLYDLMGIMESKLAELKENNSFKKELTKVDQRLKTYDAIVRGRAWSVPLVTGDKVEFLPLVDFLSEQRVMSAQGKGENPVYYLFNDAKSKYLTLRGDHYMLELTYFKWNLFLWSMFLSLIGILVFVSLKNPIPGAIITTISLGLQITAMVMRINISGRAPITNMYETVMFSGFGALVLSCIISFYRKEKSFVIAGLSYNVLCLMMMKFANGMLDPNISPLVPVLRDNFWLSTHVTTVILSYAALALSWIIANSVLLRSRFGTMSSADYRYGVDLIYTCMKYGVVLLAGGVILGGVWADYSWGRFWGWDPKETWSLIVLLVYMAILHGKYTSWIPPHRFVPLVAGAFMTVMMAWFGVNYILASGLHSYGFSEGGAIFLGSFFLIQIVVLLIGTIKKSKPETAA